MTDELDLLEAQLLVLGRQELQLEQNLRELRANGRAAAERGDVPEAEAAWSLYEDVRTALVAVQGKIGRIEATLYSKRRRRS